MTVSDNACKTSGCAAQQWHLHRSPCVPAPRTTLPLWAVMRDSHEAVHTPSWSLSEPTTTAKATFTRQRRQSSFLAHRDSLCDTLSNHPVGRTHLERSTASVALSERLRQRCAQNALNTSNNKQQQQQTQPPHRHTNPTHSTRWHTDKAPSISKLLPKCQWPAATCTQLDTHMTPWGS